MMMGVVGLMRMMRRITRMMGMVMRMTRTMGNGMMIMETVSIRMCKWRFWLRKRRETGGDVEAGGRVGNSGRDRVIEVGVAKGECEGGGKEAV